MKKGQKAEECEENGKKLGQGEGTDKKDKEETGHQSRDLHPKIGNEPCENDQPLQREAETGEVCKQAQEGEERHSREKVLKETDGVCNKVLDAHCSDHLLSS